MKDLMIKLINKEQTKVEDLIKNPILIKNNYFDVSSIKIIVC